MPIPNSVQRQDRFAMFNANLAKNPQPTTDYPRMLTNPTDKSTVVVQDPEEHKKLVGTKRFESEPFWGPQGGVHAAPFNPETTQVERTASTEPNEVNIPESARLRKGLKARGIDGNSGVDLIPPQTTFDAALPDPEQVVKNPSLGLKTEFKGT